MKTITSLVGTCVLATLVAVGGCKKKPSGSPPPAVVVTVTVTGAVDQEGNFEKGGFVVAGKRIDGTDPNGLAAELRASKSAAAGKPGGMLVRMLVYPSTPYGVVRKVIAAAAKAEARSMALVCIESGDPKAKGIGFTTEVATGKVAKLRIWPNADSDGALFRIGNDEAYATVEAAGGALAMRKADAPGGVVVLPADAVTAGQVAAAMEVAGRAGFKDIRFGPDAMRDKAPDAQTASTSAPAPLPPDDEPIPPGPTPQSSFSGAAGPAYNVVYLIDRSGSMVTDWDQVRAALLKSIDALKPEQYFHVVFFGGRRPIENPPRTLIRANDANKKNARDFIKAIPSSGVTQPIPAITRAFDVLSRARRSRPGKLIYLLTDGDFSGEMKYTDNEAVLRTIRARNADKKVVIHTLLYGKKSAEGEKILKTIAADSGGKYLFVEKPE